MISHISAHVFPGAGRRRRRATTRKEFLTFWAKVDDRDDRVVPTPKKVLFGFTSANVVRPEASYHLKPKVSAEDEGGLGGLGARDCLALEEDNKGLLARCSSLGPRVRARPKAVELDPELGDRSGGPPRRTTRWKAVKSSAFWSTKATHEVRKE